MADIIITIPDLYIEDFKAAFLRVRPKPTEFTGTDVEWIKENVRQNLYSMYEAGRLDLSAIDSSIVE